ncbi:MAG: hypothetical protein CVU09_00385 [Bacteroidetes bacterium HGW-Bacteroidetes-4]|jgi:excisionase family DNA binding protein|nr:MAG: hypothetical protein CVU09_00385 [Bacteroidetes bacterium HGW-Bacteroidetes-4]
MKLSDLASLPNLKIEVSIDDLKEFAHEIIKEFIKINQDDKDYLMSLEELQRFLPENPARQTVYQWISNRMIPYEKHGSRLYFRKSKIKEWLHNGRQMNHLNKEL